MGRLPTSAVVAATSPIVALSPWRSLPPVQSVVPPVSIPAPISIRKPAALAAPPAMPDAVAVPAAPERDEVFEVRWLPLAEALRRALEGEIVDAKTVIALQRAAHRTGVRAGPPPPLPATPEASSADAV